MSSLIEFAKKKAESLPRGLHYVRVKRKQDNTETVFLIRKSSYLSFEQLREAEVDWTVSFHPQKSGELILFRLRIAIEFDLVMDENYLWYQDDSHVRFLNTLATQEKISVFHFGLDNNFLWKHEASASRAALKDFEMVMRDAKIYYENVPFSSRYDDLLTEYRHSTYFRDRHFLDDLRLGQVLVSSGAVTAGQLERALQEQKARQFRGPIGHLLVELDYCRRLDVAWALYRQKEDYFSSKRLGILLREKGLVQETDIVRALDEQKKDYAPIGEILIRNRAITTEVFNETLREQSQQRVTGLRFGDLLVKDGAITEEQLKDALIMQRDLSHPLGELLITLQACRQQDLIWALQRQVGTVRLILSPPPSSSSS